MRLKPWQRLALMIIGVALLGPGGLGTALGWPEAAQTPTIGAISLLLAVVGALPRVSIKDWSVEWPSADEKPVVAALKADVARLHEEVRRLRKLVDGHLRHDQGAASGHVRWWRKGRARSRPATAPRIATAASLIALPEAERPRGATAEPSLVAIPGPRPATGIPSFPLSANVGDTGPRHAVRR